MSIAKEILSDNHYGNDIIDDEGNVIFKDSNDESIDTSRAASVTELDDARMQQDVDRQQAYDASFAEYMKRYDALYDHYSERPVQMTNEEIDKEVRDRIGNPPERP